MAGWRRLIDGALDATVAPGYSRFGYEVRSRSADWESLPNDALRDRVIVITGATSGLGLATARRVRVLGGSLILVGRDRERTANAVRTLSENTPGSGGVEMAVADMAEPEQVRAACRDISNKSAVDVLIHNAGALSKHRLVNSAGLEATLAAQVVGPFIMTSALTESLESTSGRVITVSSGGMYAATLPDMAVDDPAPLDAETYDGTRQYATAKRMQVTLNEMWASRLPSIRFAAMHPGWADTPGVRSSLPGFARLTGPFLRDADQGADTIVWLSATADANLVPSGGFWCDRARRPIHRLASTRKSDDSVRREALWSWCEREATKRP